MPISDRFREKKLCPIIYGYHHDLVVGEPRERNKRLRNPKSSMENPEKLTTLHTQDT
jgi:hypothetical protein